MTNPNEMQAGQELDTMIATEVMGWGCKELRMRNLPMFSTEGTPAMNMLGKLIVDGWTIFLEGDDESWGCRVQENGDPHERMVIVDPRLTSIWADAPDAPLAACRAALAAVRAGRESSC